MTLEELVYQINGELKVERALPDSTVKISLLDNTLDVAVISFHDAHPNIDACVTGKTLEEARRSLANLLRSNLLIHNWPVMWKSSEAIIRIPETLTA